MATKPAKLLARLRATAAVLTLPLALLAALTAAGGQPGRASAAPLDAGGSSTDGAPIVSGISPPVGPLAGGTVVTISGSRLSAASAVDFGPVAAQSFAIVSDTQLTATSPAGSGTVEVTVTTPGGTSAAGSSAEEYTYVALPAVTAISPAAGPSAGGTAVTIAGTGFTGASTVDFGSTPAQSLRVLTDAKLTVVAPAGATGHVNVTVINADGRSAT
ncbi:MAG: IPT/TIG domain-containing protein, partial [Solirubrobacteraceae bacterium]